MLIEGRWFAVADSLVNTVDLYFESLPNSAIALPPSIPGELEGDYNKRLAESSPSHVLNLDVKIKRPGGATSGIELCDAVTLSGEFIHVKRKSRSSTLNHLFAQGSVSAETFIGDGEFCDAIRSEITKVAPVNQLQQWLSLIPPSGQTVDRTPYTVTYAVITGAGRTKNSWLPFFSKLNLMQHGKHLHNLAMKVSISRIDVAVE